MKTAENTLVLNKIKYILLFYRTLKKLSQVEMAEAVSISHRNYQRLESGEIEPKLETVNRIACFLKINPDSLVKPTDCKTLHFKKFDSSDDFKKYINEFYVPMNTEFSTDSKSGAFNTEVELKNSKGEKIFQTHTNGSSAVVCKSLIELTGVHDLKNINDYILSSSIAEQWELIYRKNMNQAITINCFMFPTGFKVFEQFYYHIDSNPTHPISSCLIRDITSTESMDYWIQNYLRYNSYNCN